MKWALDDIDVQILRIAAEHHGLSIAEICREAIGIKFSTCRNRVNLLLEGKYLRAKSRTREKIIFSTQKAKRALTRRD